MSAHSSNAKKKTALKITECSSINDFDSRPDYQLRPDLAEWPQWGANELYAATAWTINRSKKGSQPLRKAQNSNPYRFLPN
jgi:hypothetical protein